MTDDSTVTIDSPISNAARGAAGVAKLAEKFPLTFAVLNHRRRPLKVGIRDDVVALMPEMAPEEIAFVIKYYASGGGYLRACMNTGAARIGLDCAEAGRVTTTEAAHAARRYAALQRKRKSAPPAIPPDATTDDGAAQANAARRLGLSDLKRAALARKRETNNSMEAALS